MTPLKIRPMPTPAPIAPSPPPTPRAIARPAPRATSVIELAATENRFANISHHLLDTVHIQGVRIFTYRQYVCQTTGRRRCGPVRRGPADRRPRPAPTPRPLSQKPAAPGPPPHQGRPT